MWLRFSNSNWPQYAVEAKEVRTFEICIEKGVYALKINNENVLVFPDDDETRNAYCYLLFKAWENEEAAVIDVCEAITDRELCRTFAGMASDMKLFSRMPNRMKVNSKPALVMPKMDKEEE